MSDLFVDERKVYSKKRSLQSRVETLFSKYPAIFGQYDTDDKKKNAANIFVGSAIISFDIFTRTVVEWKARAVHLPPEERADYEKEVNEIDADVRAWAGEIGQG